MSLEDRLKELKRQLKKARKRNRVEWENYSRWANGRLTEKPVPDGPDSRFIPGLELAVKILEG